MKKTNRVCLWMLGACVLQHVTVQGAESTTVKLRYNFPTEVTNVYRVSLESQGDNGREAVAGTFTLSARRVGPNLTALSLRGRFTSQTPFRADIGFGLRPSEKPSLSSLMVSPVGQVAELVVDERGTILRQAGDTPLPMPCGQLLASLLERFPVEAANTWQQEADAPVLDEPLATGPVTSVRDRFAGNVPMAYYEGYGSGRAPQGSLAARLKSTVQVIAVAGPEVTLQKSVRLESLMFTGAEPRASAEGESKIVFDRSLGVPKRVSFAGKSATATENTTRRRSLSLDWQLIEGPAREVELAQISSPHERALEKLTPEAVNKLMALLQSDDSSSRLLAATRLSRARLESPPSPELMSLMASLMDEPDRSLRYPATIFVAANATQEQVPRLLKALADGETLGRTEIVRSLGRIKDPRAIKPLVALLASGSPDWLAYASSRPSDVATALARFGPEVEPAVLEVLKEKNLGTRCQVCLVLKSVGTKQSLPVLKELALDPKKELREAAGEAYNAIQARELQQ